ncbi:dihydropteroate synthase [Noviherbaspirillum sp. ST9]|uniref:dihydropteroate synthase n=1 Tax=Noviherbaspirillum sp. ST9 TaxID=3401606 RepID=UPI003B588F56
MQIKETIWQVGRFRFAMGGPGSRTLVVGILNVNPDSFSDGGRYDTVVKAVARANAMIAEGADIIEIGGESTRPGATPVPGDEEQRRILPVISALRDCGVPIAVDTFKPDVMRAALGAGADMINDVNGFRHPESVQAVHESDCGLCIMHAYGPAGDLHLPSPAGNVTNEVREFFYRRVRALEQEGIARHRMCIDPGFGFGKTVAQNLALLSGIHYIKFDLHVPLLAGLSRKSMLGEITGKPVRQRTAASIAAALAATAHGASIVRVHDVAETVDALKVWQAAA